MTDARQICIVDDDDAVLDSLRLYFESKGVQVRIFTSAASFLEALASGVEPSCLVSDVRMPGMTGLELQGELTSRATVFPIIFITGHGDVPMAVAAFRNGAHDFIEKPFDVQRLLAAIEDAIKTTDQRYADREAIALIAARIDELSNRQRQVMDLAVRGLSTKEIAQQLGVSPRTVETYRAWVMEKLGARNLAALVRMAMRVEESEIRT